MNFEQVRLFSCINLTNPKHRQHLTISMRFFILCLALLPFSLAHSQEAFVSVWNTGNPGITPSNALRIPLNAIHGPQYSFTVNWGDGSEESFSGGTHPEHVYAEPGIYTVSITGAFPAIRCIGSSDGRKLLSVEQWGDIAWLSFSGAFAGCSSLVVNALDAPDLTEVTQMNHAFSQCVSMNQPIGHWDVGNVQNMESMFTGASTFNQPLNDWDVSSVPVTNRQHQLVEG
jgi:hypothetical protein